MLRRTATDNVPACERCGRQVVTVGRSIHHRKPRRMGGTRSAATQAASNLLVVCGSGTTGCHGWVEAHRTQALADGWLLHDGDEPLDTRVLRRHVWVLLDDNGGWRPA